MIMIAALAALAFAGAAPDRLAAQGAIGSQAGTIAPGSGSYICTPSGFGRKAQCFLR